MGSAPTIWLNYRPVRVGWLVEKSNLEEVYEAIGMTTSLWGGSYNPIIPIENEEHAMGLIDAFGVDTLVTVGDSSEAREFQKKFPHLRLDGWRERPFTVEGSRFVDVRHAAAKLNKEMRRTNGPNRTPVTRPVWEKDDPLRYLYASLFGGYLSPEKVVTDYARDFFHAINMRDHRLTKGSQLDPFLVDTIKPLDIAGWDLTLQSSGRGLVNNYPGIFVGNAKRFEDVVNFWNLKASGAYVAFLDVQEIETLRSFLNQHLARIRFNYQGNVLGIWSNLDDLKIDEWKLDFGDLEKTICKIDFEQWAHGQIKPVNISFSQSHHDIIPSYTDDGKTQSVTFGLPDKPFLDDNDLSEEYFVVSVTAMQYGRFPVDGLTFNTPFVPQMNEYYGRNYCYEYDRARSENIGINEANIGIIQNIRQQRLTLNAISTHGWITNFFKHLGINAVRSKPGYLCSRLISQLEGLQGCRVFKIKGTRTLLKKYGPDQSFTRTEAEKVIGNFDLTTKRMRFDEYKDLYISNRGKTELTPRVVFDYLLSHNVFRPGLEFRCPNCELESWIHVDEIKTISDCVYCGHAFHIGSQLKGRGDWRYRRSGIFGKQDDQLGSIPVSLALQQLDTTFHRDMLMASTSIELTSIDSDIEKCEVDFLIVTRGANGLREHPVQIIFGEAKTTSEIDENDIRKMHKLAKAIPPERAGVSIMFAKTGLFTEHEIKLAKTLEKEMPDRVILWSERQLEPYHIYEGEKHSDGMDIYASFPKQLGRATSSLYFEQSDKIIEIDIGRKTKV